MMGFCQRRCGRRAGLVSASTLRRDFAVDSLQLQPRAIADAIRDCGSRQPRAPSRPVSSRRATCSSRESAGSRAAFEPRDSGAASARPVADGSR